MNRYLEKIAFEKVAALSDLSLHHLVKRNDQLRLAIRNHLSKDVKGTVGQIAQMRRATEAGHRLGKVQKVIEDKLYE